MCGSVQVCVCAFEHVYPSYVTYRIRKTPWLMNVIRYAARAFVMWFFSLLLVLQRLRTETDHTVYVLCKTKRKRRNWRRRRRRRRRNDEKTDENTKRIKRAPRLIRLESEIKIGFLGGWSGHNVIGYGVCIAYKRDERWKNNSSPKWADNKTGKMNNAMVIVVCEKKPATITTTTENINACWFV